MSEEVFDNSSENSEENGGFYLKKSEVSENVYDLARKRMRELYSLFDTVVVSFSGGKDSTAVLNIAIEAAQEVRHGKVKAIFFDEEVIQNETVDYVRRVYESPEVDLTWYCLPVEHRNACSRKHPYWWPWEPESEELWVRPLPPEATTYKDFPAFPIKKEDRPSIPTLIGLPFPAKEFGRTAIVLGIRAQESLTRLSAIVAPTPDSRPWIRKLDTGFSQGNIWKAYPIYDWTTEDVWTAPKKFGWDYNHAYDVMRAAGISSSQQRVCPPFGEEAQQNYWMYAPCFPDIWEKMCMRVPGAATVARYGRTELYGWGGNPEKPKDVSWEDFLRSFIEKHADHTKGQVAARVRNWHGQHFAKTKDPLAVKAPHYTTGVCWNFLLQIAIRGDFKQRKRPRRPGYVDEGMVKKYWAEIAEMRERGELPEPKKGGQ